MVVIQKYKKTLQLMLLIVIVLSFIFLNLVQNNSKDSDAIVKIGNHNITNSELNNAIEIYTKLFQQNKNFNDSDFSSSVLSENVFFRKIILDELIKNHLLDYERKTLKLTIDDKTLSKKISQIPEIQEFYVNNKFDIKQYKQFLKRNNTTVNKFENDYKNSILKNQILFSVPSTCIVSNAVIKKILDHYNTEREIQIIKFYIANYIHQINPKKKEIEFFYKQNISLFQVPEKIDVEYVLLKNIKKTNQFFDTVYRLLNLANKDKSGLQSIAKRFNANSQKIKNITSSEVRNLSSHHPLNSNNILSKFFSKDMIQNKDIVLNQIDSNTILLVHLLKYYPENTIPLSQVEKQIEQQIVSKQALNLAIQIGQKKIECLQNEKCSDQTHFTKPIWISHHNSHNLNQNILKRIMSVHASRLPVMISDIDKDRGEFVIYKINKIIKKKKRINFQENDNPQLQRTIDLLKKVEIDQYFNDIKFRAVVKKIQEIH